LSTIKKDFRASLEGGGSGAIAVDEDEDRREGWTLLSQGAERMLSAAKAQGMRTLLLSGGFTFFTERLKTRLGLDYAFSNTLEISNGRLSGRVLGTILDAQGKVLGRLATQVVCLLRGKHKPIYTPHLPVGDYVVVINAVKVRVSGKKIETKLYRWHTGHPGGLRERTLEQMLAQHPERVIQRAVKGMVPFQTDLRGSVEYKTYISAVTVADCLETCKQMEAAR